MRKEGETHELKMTERKGRNEHESESVALLLPVGIEIKKRTEALSASALYPLYILPHGNTLVLCILLLLEHHLHLDQAELAEPHDIVIAVVHIDRDLLPRFHVEIVGNQCEALVAVRQSGQESEDLRLDVDQLVNLGIDSVLHLDKAVKLVRVFRAGDCDCIQSLRHVGQAFVRVSDKFKVLIDFPVYLPRPVQPLPSVRGVYCVQISSPQNKSM